MSPLEWQEIGDVSECMRWYLARREGFVREIKAQRMMAWRMMAGWKKQDGTPVELSDVYPFKDDILHNPLIDEKQLEKNDEIWAQWDKIDTEKEKNAE